MSLSHTLESGPSLGSWLVQRAGGGEVVDRLLRPPCAVRQASLPPGQPETAEPAVKAIEEESERYFLESALRTMCRRNRQLFPMQRTLQFQWVLYIK